MMIKNEKGVSAVIVALLLVVFLGIGALAIDIGYLAVVKNECQNAADAAALAGARQMGENYGSSNVDLTLNVVEIAQQIGQANRVDTKNLAVDNMVIQLGHWDAPNSTIITPSNAPDTVCVEVKRESGLTSGPIGTFFAKAPPIGKSNYNVSAKSCAALTGPCEGKPTIPLGISKDWYDNHVCNAPDDINMNATPVSCAGWTNLSSNDFKNDDPACMIDCSLCSDTVLCPPGNTKPQCITACNNCSGSPCRQNVKTISEVNQGDFVGFGGGTVTGNYEALKRLWQLKCTVDPADGICKWETFVAVYDDGPQYCPNPKGSYEIKSFAHVVITNVVATATDKGVHGTVACRSTEEPGGCFNAGTVNKSPHLVK